MENSPFKYSYKTKTKESLAIAVYNTGMQKCDAHTSWGPAIRDHYLIHYVSSGRGTYICEGVSHSIQPGDLFIAYPNKVISYYADQEDPWEYLWVGFHGTEADRLIRLTPFHEGNLILHPEEPGLAEDLIRIYEARGTKPFQELQMIGRLYSFLARLAELQPEPKDITDITSAYLENALKFIQYNYSRSIDIADIAGSIGISRSHLYRVFIKHLGLSPNEYLTRYRINKACSLLRSSNLSVANIASSVGYEDSLYFSRVFKKIKGVSPSRYLYATIEEQTGEASERNGFYGPHGTP